MKQLAQLYNPLARTVRTTFEYQYDEGKSANAALWLSEGEANDGYYYWVNFAALPENNLETWIYTDTDDTRRPVEERYQEPWLAFLPNKDQKIYNGDTGFMGIPFSVKYTNDSIQFVRGDPSYSITDGHFEITARSGNETYTTLVYASGFNRYSGVLATINFDDLVSNIQVTVSYIPSITDQVHGLYFEWSQYPSEVEVGLSKALSEARSEGGWEKVPTRIFTSVSDVLSIEVLPDITLGFFIFFPVVLGFIITLAKAGGKD